MTRLGGRCRILGGLLIAVALAACVSTAAAQTYGGTGVLKIKPGARATGMGQSGVALFQRAHSVWWNPALLAQIDGDEVSSTVAKLVPGLAEDVYYLNLAFAHHFEGWGGIAVNFMYLTYGETEAVDIEGKSHGYFSSYEFVPAVGFGTQVFSWPDAPISEWDLGVNLKYVWVDLAPEWAMQIVGVNKDGRASAIAIDFGTLIGGTLGIPYAIGVNVQNVGDDLVYIEADEGDPLPRNLKAGFALDFSDLVSRGGVLSVLFTMDANKALIEYPDPREAEARPKWGWGNTKSLLNYGAEVSFYRRLSVRVGFIKDPEGEIDGSVAGLKLGAATFSAGLDVDISGGSDTERMIRFDYASVPQALDLDRVHYLSLGMQF